MLIAYSDGVTECRNSKDEEFEMGRLSVAVKAVGGACANQVLFSTLGAVLDFANACTIYTTHYRHVLRVCRHFFQRREDAQDAAAEVFLKLHRVLETRNEAMPFVP
jgi:hypothetical protein